ncbi:MAG TPA: transcription antitermination factor NusB [Clostridiales bacterium]|nr:transcription antitermination factor NusB [Clostridiales bacterium]
MTRRQIREHIFLMLFRKEFYSTDELNEQMKIYLEEMEKVSIEENSYLEERFQGILSKLNEVDEILSEISSGWKLDRLGKVELTILRLGIYEMRFDDEIPVKVAINEAVELSKKFGGDDTPGFVNGVLAKIV